MTTKKKLVITNSVANDGEYEVDLAAYNEIPADTPELSTLGVGYADDALPAASRFWEGSGMALWTPTKVSSSTTYNFNTLSFEPEPADPNAVPHPELSQEVLYQLWLYHRDMFNPHNSVDGRGEKVIFIDQPHHPIVPVRLGVLAYQERMAFVGVDFGQMEIKHQTDVYAENRASRAENRWLEFRTRAWELRREMQRMSEELQRVKQPRNEQPAYFGTSKPRKRW